MKKTSLALVMFLAGTATLRAETIRIEFEPKIGSIGTKVVVKTRPPEGCRARLGEKSVPISEDGPGLFSFLVPPEATTSFLEFVREDRTLGRSSVPFVVVGRSLVLPKISGLRDSIDVFAYSDPKPSGGERPEPTARPFLSLDDQDILTIGEPSPTFMSPAVDLSDAASMAIRPMYGTFLLVTARLPKKKLLLRIPPPVAPPAPDASE